MGFMARLMSKVSRRLRRAARKALRVVWRATKNAVVVVTNGVAVIVRRTKKAAKKHHRRMKTSETYRRKTAATVTLVQNTLAPFLGAGAAVLRTLAVLYFGLYETTASVTA